MYHSGQLIRAKPHKIPIVSHYGILLVDRGEVSVLHNTPKRGAVIDGLDKWLSTREFISVEDTALSQYSNDEIIKRFYAQCKKDYRLLSYNCEHFIDCMLFEEKQKSEQLIKWSLGLGFATLLLIIYKKR